MPRRPLDHVSAELSERIKSIEIARAQLYDVDADRKKQIDDAIDYFGAGRIGLARDQRGGESLPRRDRRPLRVKHGRQFASALRGLVGVGLLGLLTSACAMTSGAPPGTDTGRAPAPSSTTREPSRRPLDRAEAERLQRVMAPLVRAMDHARPLDQVKVGIMDDPRINAASGGGGEFYVTTGLLQKANDLRLAGVLAHELAHDDLGHVAKAQTLGAGLNIGMIILDQIVPGSGALTPIAGVLIARAYSRNEEYAADRHGVDILKRAGYPAQTMMDTLTWLSQTEGASSGGFFATHPATADRIEALRNVR
jgi:Zn-dependent protease with chaperone function